MFKDFFLLAARSIAHRKLRSWLTVIGIFIGITAVVALISIGLGLERTVKNQVAQVFGVDTFLILAEGTFGPGRHGGDIEGYRVDLDRVRAVDGVKVAAAVRSETGFVKGAPGADGKAVQGFLPVMGLSPELASDFQSFIGELTLQPGSRLFNVGETTSVILGYEIAERLNATVGAQIEVEDRSFDVVGVLLQEKIERQQGPFRTGMSDIEDTIFIPFDMMTELYGTSENVLITLVKTTVGADVDEVANRVESALNIAGASKVEAITYSDISDAIGTVTGTISAFLAGIAGISLLVGGVGVMNTMFTSVLERTREIGVMKAVGAKNGHILSIFLIESGLMGLVGGAFGILLGLGISGLASVIIRRTFDVELVTVASPALIIVTLLGSFALGAVAGLWPARRAAKLSVVDALRYE